jgi:hypothetical protein
MGFEERTSAAIAALVEREVRVTRAFLLEFDMYYEATAKRRAKYESLITKLTGGNTYHPLNAPVGNSDPTFSERMKHSLTAILGSSGARILFDCTSCPSGILSKCIRLFLEYGCDLTILYSEAEKYYPTREEWQSGKLKPQGPRVEGPFSGVRFVEKPSSLQADDTAERPVLLVLFPTFNTERTNGVLAELDPVKRIWLIGEPHVLSSNFYRTPLFDAVERPCAVRL